MKSGSRSPAGPTVRGDRLCLHEAIAFDNKRLLEAWPEMVVTISRVIKLHRFAAGCDHADLKSSTKCLPSGFDDRNRYDASAINTRHRLVPCSRSPALIRMRSHLQDQLTAGHQIVV